MLIEVTESDERIITLLSFCIGYPTEEKIYRKLEEYVSYASLRLYRAEDYSGILGLSDKGKGTIEIRHIAVDPAKRKQNIARMMVDEIIGKLDCSRIVLETDGSAVGFYKRCGFTAESLGEKYPGVIRYRCEKELPHVVVD